MPKLSIIMGVFNASETVAGTINSIKAQTYKDWECVICDDGSKDDTWDILKDITKDDNRFILIRNEKNLGLGATLNRCVEYAKGEYLARQDADDISLPERLEKQVIFLDNNPDISVVGTYAELYNPRQNIWGVIKPPLNPTVKDWIKGSSIIHASVVMKKRDLLEMGGYNQNAIRVEDYDLWLRMRVDGYKIRTIPEALYRITSDRTSYKRKRFKYRWNELKVKYAALKRMGIPYNYYVYLLKPLLVGLIPSKFLYAYHYQRFKKRSSD